MAVVNVDRDQCRLKYDDRRIFASQGFGKTQGSL
jgi:hypothetical protein